jgi:hypothetical protein
MSAPVVAPPGMDGLRTDQAPPLSIPASFFLLAPLAMIASGAVLAWGGDAVLATRWAPLAMAATHLGTLGFLGAVMLGALYQMIPVVAGVPVPGVRLAHAVHALFAVGLATLVAGLATGGPALLALAPALLLAALALFIGPVAIALVRAPTRSETVWGMRLAVAGLMALATLGMMMALARAGLWRVSGDWSGWVTAHASLGGAVWLGGLITAVSWQVVPMFYLTPALPRWSRWSTIGAIGLALVAIPTVLLVGGGPVGVSIGAIPAVVMVWCVHPVLTLRAIQRRRRRRVDSSVRFWWAAMMGAPLIPVLAAGALLGEDPRWSVALGWVVVWGWAGMIVHGILTRIVPFLVWFHRYASLVGKMPVPSIRGLLPDSRVRVAMVMHSSAVIVGSAAIVSGSALLARAAGALLGATGVVLAANLVHTLAPRATPKNNPGQTAA